MPLEFLQTVAAEVRLLPKLPEWLFQLPLLLTLLLLVALLLLQFLLLE